MERFEWERLTPKQTREYARRAVKYLNDSGVVREAYYRLYNDHYPIIYARMNVSPLDDIPVVFRDEAAARVIEIVTRLGSNEL